MIRYRCAACGHIYDPEQGEESSDIPPGTPFEDITESWCCPDCGVPKLDFEPIGEAS
jgi:rubredoxin